MHRDRARARGRWAAEAGANAAAFDVFARRLDLERAATADLAVLAPSTLEMLDAYAAGVNDHIAELGLAVAPWTPADSLLVHRIRHVLMGSARSKLWRAVVRDLAGERVLAAISRESDDGFAILDGGSNNWVLAGARTASGAPLLAGDPHRELEAPNVYTQSHIACPEFDAIGIGFAGVPGFGHFGHNARVAWSITHGMLDDQDLFIERFDRDGRCAFEGVPVDVDRRVERVDVADGDPIDIEVVVTPHGPVISGDTVNGEALALRWTGTCEPNRGFDCFVPMLEAGSVAELFDAMVDWVEPANNLLAADVDGAVGYLFRGRVPVRPAANGDLPVPGWTGEHEWRGWVPFAELPRRIDPSEGRIVTANNRPVPGDYPHFLGRDFAAPHRAERITELIDGLGPATVDDMVGVLGDVRSAPGMSFAERVRGAAAPDGLAGEVHRAISGWDGEVTADSAGALAYEVVRRELFRIVLERSGLAAAREHPYTTLLPRLDLPSMVWRALPKLLADDNTDALDGWTWGEAIAEALVRAASYIAAEVGDDAKTWRWGALHRTQGGVEVPGDGETVRVGGFYAASGFTCWHSAVARYVFDLADWDNSGWVLPLGVAEQAESLHATDQQPLWAAGRLAPMLYTRGALGAAAV